MFSIWKMVKKGIIALVCFLSPMLLTILFKLIPGMDSVTIGDVVLGVLEKLYPNVTTLTVGAALIMLVNYIKNYKK